jgi:hypothetical protein
MSGGVLDLTFLEISKDSELIERASEAVSKSKGSESPSKKQVLNVYPPILRLIWIIERRMESNKTWK